MAEAAPGTVQRDVDRRVATLSFANPARRGAFTPEMLTRLREELVDLGTRRGEVVSVVLRGADGIFSSGYALDRIPDPDTLAVEDEIEHFCAAIEASPLVVVAMLDGFAIGAALDVAAACDVRFATRDCRLGITPAKFGLVYTVNGTARIHRLVGGEWARRLFFTGDLIDGSEAARIGLVSEVHDDSVELHEATYGFARSIADRAPLSVAGAKDIIRELERRGPDLDAATRARLHDLRRTALRSPDCLEARAAFKQRRSPRFTGEEDL